MLRWRPCSAESTESTKASHHLWSPRSFFFLFLDVFVFGYATDAGVIILEIESDRYYVLASMHPSLRRLILNLVTSPFPFHPNSRLRCFYTSYISILLYIPSELLTVPLARILQIDPPLHSIPTVDFATFTHPTSRQERQEQSVWRSRPDQTQDPSPRPSRCRTEGTCPVSLAVTCSRALALVEGSLRFLSVRREPRVRWPPGKMSSEGGRRKDHPSALGFIMHHGSGGLSFLKVLSLPHLNSSLALFPNAISRAPGRHRHYSRKTSTTYLERRRYCPPEGIGSIPLRHQKCL